jgi:anti-sigma B factor antagonist
MNITTNVRQVGDVAIVDITGNIVFGEESAALHAVVSGLLKKGQKQILLNLGGVNFIDSMGMGSLVGAFTSVRKQGGELKLLNLSNKVADVMEMTRLYTVFDVMIDEVAGVKSFGQSTSASAAKS